MSRDLLLAIAQSSVIVFIVTQISVWFMDKTDMKLPNTPAGDVAGWLIAVVWLASLFVSIVLTLWLIWT
jgi:hypothetical protein